MLKEHKGRPCYYCGKLADTTDHVIPQSLLKQYKLTCNWQSLHKLEGNRILSVPSCLECNCLASDSFQRTVKNRKYFVKEKLKKRYKKILDMPEWTEDELEEMSDRLQQSIMAAQEQKKLIQQRIDW